jgi:hypothetical protein
VPEQTILYINPDDSRCGHCRHGADPRETRHVTVLSYYENGPEGCGRTFTAVSSDFHLGVELRTAIREMRPDLPLVTSEGRPMPDPRIN